MCKELRASTASKSYIEGLISNPLTAPIKSKITDKQRIYSGMSTKLLMRLIDLETVPTPVQCPLAP